MRPGVLDPDQYAARPRSRRGASTSRLHRAADIIGPFPDQNGSMTRPSSMDREQMLACGRGETCGPGKACPHLQTRLTDREHVGQGKDETVPYDTGGGLINKTT